MTFLRTYFTIGSVMAALRIIFSMVVTKSNRLYKFYTDENERIKWLLDRPFIQALNCLVSIITWPLEVGGTITTIVRCYIRIRKETKNNEATNEEVLYIKNIDEEDES